jgi:membrane associated rhomboid family serine protease
MNGQQYEVYTPPLSPSNKVLLLATGVMLIVQAVCEGMMQIPLNSYLGLSLSGITRGHLYQLASYPLVQEGLMSYLFSALILWFVGSDIERGLGTKRYLLLVSLSVLGASLTFLVVPLLLGHFISLSPLSPPLVGISGICFSLLILYGTMYGERVLNIMLLFPIKARYFCWILIGIELYMGLFSSYSRSSWGHLGGMAFAYLYFRYLLFQKSNASKTKKSLASRINSRKGHLHLVKENSEKSEKEDKPRYFH